MDWVLVLSCCHPALWILDQVRNDVTSWPTGTQRGVAHPPCGYWIKSSMTDRSGNDGEGCGNDG